jgi:hypothetical protein
MYRIALLVMAIGCVGEHADPQPAPTFAQDTYYTGVVAPYATPEACASQADNPITCHLELGFCAGGTAAFSNFDLPERGDYVLDGPMVVAHFASEEAGAPATVIQLDTRTGAATNANTDTYILDDAGRWNTLQFDAGSYCPDDAP